MQLTFLGGAREIGASSCLLEIDGKRLLIDCGIRLQQWGDKSLPDIDRLRKLDLVLITHAHMDHAGGLPKIYERFSCVKTICTPPTFHLMVALFRDAHKLSEFHILEKRKGGPVTKMSYDNQTIEAVAKNIFLAQFRKWFKPFPDADLKICFISAGHILGASCILISGEEGNVMFSGDFCMNDQKTIHGLRLEEIDFQPDVLICESTYGDKPHESRGKEEEKLVLTIKEVMQERGNILIPAFAIGRAQELALILESLRDSGAVPTFPIFIDGLVREITAMYQKLHGKPEIGYGKIMRVHGDARGSLINYSKPSLVISSSGNLSGGPSVFYAQQILGDARNAILFSGYQDEESPGRRILRLREDEEIELDGERYSVKCRIRRYNLSAHADAEQLHQFVCSLNPKAVVLVHGQKKQTRTLSNSLSKDYDGLIWIPFNGKRFNPLSVRSSQRSRGLITKEDRHA